MHRTSRSIKQRLFGWRNRIAKLTAANRSRLRPTDSDPGQTLTFERLDPRQLMAIVPIAPESVLTQTDLHPAMTSFVGPVAPSTLASPTTTAAFTATSNSSATPYHSSYAINKAGQLFGIDLQTGRNQLLFNTGLAETESLAFGPGQQLFAVAERNRIFHIDLMHRTTRLLNPNPPASWPSWIESLAFDGKDLFATASFDSRQPTANTLVKIDLNNFSLQTIGPMGNLGTDVEGLAIGPTGKLWASNLVDNRLLQIDRASGQARQVNTWTPFVTNLDTDWQGQLWGLAGQDRGFGAASLVRIDVQSGALIEQHALGLADIVGFAVAPRDLVVAHQNSNGSANPPGSAGALDPAVGQLPGGAWQGLEDTGGGDEPSGGNGGGGPGGGTGGNDPEDPVQATVVVSNAAGYEGELLKFRLELEGSPEAGPESITVEYAFRDQTATQPDDYTPDNNSVTLSWSNPIGYILVDANHDLQAEMTEQFFVTVTAGEGVAVRYTEPSESGEAIGTIQDDATDTLTLALDDLDIAEGESGSLRVSLSRPAPQALAVQYQSLDDSATTADGDYQALAGTLHFAKGETVKYISVNSLANDDVTPRERYRIEASITDEENAQTKTAHVSIVESEAVTIELDIDSNNNGSIDESDDAIENNPQQIGKIVPVNNGDFNRNQIVDWADWSGSRGLVPLRLSLTGQFDWNSAKVHFSYQASDPQSVAGNENLYTRDPGNLRLWTPSAAEERNPASISDGGNYIGPGWYSLALLGFSESQRVVDLFIEGLQASAALADQQISVELDPGSGYEESPDDQLSDAVRLTVAAVDADVDTLNDNFQGSRETADQREFRLNQTGAIVLANRLDRNADGVPGFADGIDRWGNAGDRQSGQFSKFRVAIPAWVDITEAKLAFQYQAANPEAVTRTEVGTEEWSYAPGSGNAIRIWQRNGIYSRQVADINSGGDFVDAKVYDASEFVWQEDDQWQYVELYLEGIHETEQGAAQIGVRMDLDGAGPAGWVLEDQVRLSVVDLKLVYTDVSGITGPAAEKLTRIHRDREPNGVTADWQLNVPDGSTLLVRVIVPDYLYQEVRGTQSQPAPHRLDIAFGEIGDTTRVDPFIELIDDNGFWFSLDEPGRFDESPFSDGFEALERLDIDGPADTYKNQDRRVLAAAFFQPPWEANPDNQSNLKSRRVPLAIKAEGVINDTGGRTGQGLTIARPPIITVHGVSSSPETWNSFKQHFDNDEYGYHVNDFSVAHDDIDHGNGNLTSIWTRVASMTQRASYAYRAGQTSSGLLFGEEQGQPLMIAHQKSFIVAHSYGGLISRWYLEQAPDPQNPDALLFDRRRDVMRLITLGTPHKGSPITNIVTESLKDGLVGNSNIAQLDLTHLELLEALQDPDSMFSANGPTYTHDPVTKKPLPAMEILTVGSELLRRLNTNPFHDDVTYAAVVGIDNADNLLYSNVHPVYASPASFKTTSFFPWIRNWTQAKGSTDNIVPEWSAGLGIPAFNAKVLANHTNLPAHMEVFDKVESWLSGRTSANQPQWVPSGDYQRQGFSAEIPASFRNALVGSTFSAQTGLSSGGGFNRDALQKVEFISSDPSARYGVYPETGIDTDYSWGTSAEEAGIQRIALTGMIQWKDRQAVKIRLFDVGLRNRMVLDAGTLTEAQLNIPAWAKVGVTANDWVPFRITHLKLARDNENKLIFPGGQFSIVSQRANLRYELTVPRSLPVYSRATEIALPNYVLQPPVYNAQTQVLRLTGTARAVPNGQQLQQTVVSLRHNVAGAPVTLLNLTVDIEQPADVWEGVLLPYSVDVQVTFDASGRIWLNDQFTGLTTIQVYQQVLETTGNTQQKSTSITIKK